MERVFITSMQIEKVRHLKDITIPLSETNAKHLILTGKNGSGKTSVLEAMANYLNTLINKRQNEKRLKKYALYMVAEEDFLDHYKEAQKSQIGMDVSFNIATEEVFLGLEKGQFVVAYYKAERHFKADISNQVEKVHLQDYYAPEEKAHEVFVNYMVHMKVVEAMARVKGDLQRANEIALWFDSFQKLLRRIFDDASLELLFDEETFEFSIKETGRECFGFNQLSSGFAAVLDIITDLIVRMAKQANRAFRFQMPGIVLIDEIETHLHLDMQKSVLDLLTTVFPNIQFIVTTHSPFVLNSLENAVIYDLEKKTLVQEGLANIPYSGIVEGYFKADALSVKLRNKFERYKQLVQQQDLCDDDFEEIAELEMYLNEIPDYLALDITTEYQRLKLEFIAREDI